MRDGVDLSPLGLAQLISDLIERLELDHVTIVGNDTGGALCQLVCAHHPERIGRLVLTNCDAFENFPPPAFRLVVRALARVPGAVAALDVLGRLRVMRRATMAIAPLTVEPVADSLVKGWISPLHDRHIRRDLVRALQGISPQHTLDAAERLRTFDRPALINMGDARPLLPVQRRRAPRRRATEFPPRANRQREDLRPAGRAAATRRPGRRVRLRFLCGYRQSGLIGQLVLSAGKAAEITRV
jgi:pimeloyl-ACP methyl ester carboxylesterase